MGTYLDSLCTCLKHFFVSFYDKTDTAEDSSLNVNFCGDVVKCKVTGS